MTQATPITVAYGDGIGPEIMEAALRIMQSAGAQLDIETILVGEKAYHAGHSGGISPEAWTSLRRTRVLFKAPITTPQGGGFKSLNVTLRKSMGMYANVRPCVSYAPFIETKHPLMDVVVIRENEEDLYAGIEHRQTDEVFQCLKLISRPGSERIIRYGFEYARRNQRRKVSCFTKDNIMKMTDGLFHKIFEEVAQEYPDIQSEHMIIDIGTARLASHPDQFDVLILPNLYGDILSDVTAQLTGSVGLGGSANVGEHLAMFEAIHGSAPDIAGKGIANPSGLLLAGVMMLVHIGQSEVAEKIHNAWLLTLEDGIHTGDIYKFDFSRERATTESFTDAVIARLGQEPAKLRAVRYAKNDDQDLVTMIAPTQKTSAKKDLLGVDVFLDWDEDQRDPNVLGELLASTCNGDGLTLKMITNRGQKVYPDGMPETFCTDHWRCRFVSDDDQPIQHQQVVRLLDRVVVAGLDFIKTENLFYFDGERGYTLGQGE